MQYKNNTPPKARNSTYILTGENAFRKRRYLDKLRQRLVGEKTDAFNYTLYYAKDTTAADVINSLQTFSIAGNSRMIVLVEPELLPEEDKKSLIGHIRHYGQKDVFFVMIGGTPSAGLDEFIDSLPENTERIPLNEIKPGDMALWVIKEFKARGKVISKKNADLVAESVGQDLAAAESFIEQASLFTGDREDIADDDTKLFLYTAAENSIFSLLDAINKKAPDRALLILKDILQVESKPGKMIGFLAWHIIRLIRVKSMLSAGMPRADMISILRIKPYGFDKLVSQAREFTLTRLKNDLQSLSDTDLLIKQGNVRDDYLIEALIVKLAS
jgi:DNA polymerase III subunit delta